MRAQHARIPPPPTPANRQLPMAALIAGTVVAATGGILGLGAVVYHFTGPDGAEQTPAAVNADTGGDDTPAGAQEQTAPALPADAIDAVTPDAPEPGATTAGADRTSAVTPAATANRSGVTAGAFCSPAGATGKTATGLSMRCTRAAGDREARWRAVPATTTPPAPGPATTAPVTRPPATAPTTKPATAPTTQPTTAAPTAPETTPAAPPSS